MPEKIQVLHVDDAPAFLDLAAELLEHVDDGITVHSESDPTVVPERIDSEPYDCIISDYEMPEQDGLELCRTIRQTHPEYPFFLFTNVRGEDIIDQAMAAGATDYIRKETGVHHYRLLANRIRLAISRHRALEHIDHLEERSDEAVKYRNVRESDSDSAFIKVAPRTDSSSTPNDSGNTQ